MRKFVKLVVFNIVLFIILFLLAEVAVRILNPKYVIYKRTYPGQQSDKSVLPATNWPKKDEYFGWVSGANNSFYRLNRQGFRDSKDFDSFVATNNKRRIMILGDSFVFGVYVKQDSTLPSLIQKKLGGNYEVFNMGMPGWGIDQIYLAYKKYTPIIKPHIVILCYISEDIDRVFEAFNENMDKPSFELKDNRLVLRKDHFPGFFEKITYHSYILNRLYRDLYRKYYSRKIVETIFSEMAKDAQEKKEKFIIVWYPFPREFNQNGLKKFLHRRYASFTDFFKNSTVYYLELYDKMASLSGEQYERLYLEQNLSLHPSEAGYELAADYIIKECSL